MCIQECADVSAEAKAIKLPQPVVIVRADNIVKPKDAYIVTEGQVLCQMPMEDIPYCLLCAFYAFNMQYTCCCINFYSFVEHLFLGVEPPKRVKLQHFLTSISNV